uniref:3-dehydroquinate synthase n=1 Tax=Paulinella micropora TaxID=1928728 RepID=A0A385HZE1_9EUKA|nr:3-dehydroquinate synthase [Paulinella micropora]AXY63019.1 3-dehydroquinate synthase [Paulinella micropora]
MLQTINLGLKTNSYCIAIGDRGISRLGELLIAEKFKKDLKILLVTNPEVFLPYGEEVVKHLQSKGFQVRCLIIEAGEENKTQETIQRIHDAAFVQHLERGSLIIALGGGVVGDMAGFAAATWLRGISIVQVPTTLLAMVDAAIGGKTGVNHPGGKNLIGSFHQPSLVLIDPTTLKTLPSREFRAGMAEIIKYGIIGSPALLYHLEQSDSLSSQENIPSDSLKSILKYSAQTKAQIVMEDEREGGLRAILNYGHTLGHVVETLTNYNSYLHGEAVALGMIAAGEIACMLNLWTQDMQSLQKKLIEKAGLPLVWPKLPLNSVLSCLKGDKKVQEGKVRFVLPTGLGKVVIKNDVPKEMITHVLNRISGE